MGNCCEGIAKGKLEKKPTVIVRQMPRRSSHGNVDAPMSPNPSPPAPKPQLPRNPLKIGATIPDFDLATTKGDFKFHSWLTEDAHRPWTIFFSHPKDYTPVCTTELGTAHNLADIFGQMGAKLICVSCDSVDDHHGWSQDILQRENRADDKALKFPIIADKDRDIVSQLGMLDPEEKDGAGLPLPARALVILKGTTVKLTFVYPATTGRNFDEVIRVLTSLQLTDGAGVATPVDWKHGQRVIVSPAVTTDDAKAKFEDFQQDEMHSGKPYLRSVQCPPEGQTNPRPEPEPEVKVERKRSLLDVLMGA